MHTPLQTRAYRVTLLPPTVAREDAELKADQGVLPFLQFRAPNSGVAMHVAHQLSGMPAIRADRSDRFEAVGAAAAHRRGRELHHLTQQAEEIAAARGAGA